MPRKPRAAKTTTALKPTSPPPAVIAVDAVMQRFVQDGGLYNLAAGLNTDRDKRFYSKYAAPDPDTEMSLTDVWRTSWLAKKVVNTITEDMTRMGWTVKWDGSDDKAQQLLRRVVRKHRVKPKVASGSRWGRLFGGAAIMIGIKGQEDTSQPLELDSIKKDSLRYLRVVDRWKISPVGIIDEDTDSDWWGEPMLYSITGSYGYAPMIHRSRLVMFHGVELPDNSYRARGYWHDSVLTSVLESIKNYDTATGGVASMLFESNVDILKIPGLAEMINTEAGRKKLTERFLATAIMKSFNKMLLLDGGRPVDPTNMSKGEEFEQKQINFAGVNEAILRFITDVAGAADVPVTRLFGQSPAGMDATGDSDTRNYYDHINSRQEENLLPQLLYLYEVIMRSTFGKMPEDLEIEFNPLWQLTDKEIADRNYVEAQTFEKYVGMNAMTEHSVAKELLARRRFGTFTEEDVALAEEFTTMSAEAEKAAAKAAAAGPEPGGGGEEA